MGELPFHIYSILPERRRHNISNGEAHFVSPLKIFSRTDTHDLIFSTTLSHYDKSRSYATLQLSGLFVLSGFSVKVIDDVPCLRICPSEIQIKAPLS